MGTAVAVDGGGATVGVGGTGVGSGEGEGVGVLAGCGTGVDVAVGEAVRVGGTAEDCRSTVGVGVAVAMVVGSTSGGDSGVGVETSAGVASDGSGPSALAPVAKVGSGAPAAITVTVGDGVGWISSRAGCTALSVPQAARTIASASRAGVGPTLLIANAVSSPRSITMPGELSRSYAAWQGKYATAWRYAVAITRLIG